jgi:hypothetical protein
MERGGGLPINCGLACILSDREEILDAYAEIRINCGTFIASPQVYAKLSGGNAQINTGDLRIREIKSALLQLDGGMDLTGFFILVSGNLVATEEGLAALEKAEGLIALETFGALPDRAALVPYTTYGCIGLAWLKPKRGRYILEKFIGADTPYYPTYSLLAKAAGFRQRNGIERKYRRPPPQAGAEELQR